MNLPSIIASLKILYKTAVASEREFSIFGGMLLFVVTFVDLGV